MPPAHDTLAPMHIFPGDSHSEATPGAKSTEAQSPYCTSAHECRKRAINECEVLRTGRPAMGRGRRGRIRE